MKCLNCNETNHPPEAKYCFRCGEYLISNDCANSNTKHHIINNLINNMVHVDGGTLTIRIPPKQGYVTDDEEIITRELIVPSFLIGRYLVTQEEWMVVMGRNPSKYKGARLPVEHVEWKSCQEFIKRLNVMTGMCFRMPTEAEWEFAARGGNKSRGFTYSGGNNLDEVAWYHNNTFKKGEADPDFGTHPVGQKLPNELGLYDMTGNVWEWCGDCYDNQGSSLLTDADGNALWSYNVSRGGGWMSAAGYCRVYRRIISPPTHSREFVGFRLAL